MTEPSVLDASSMAERLRPGRGRPGHDQGAEKPRAAATPVRALYRGTARVQRSRVRPPSASYTDIGFFGRIAPGHLTSTSREYRPRSGKLKEAKQHRALSPYGTESIGPDHGAHVAEGMAHRSAQKQEDEVARLRANLTLLVARGARLLEHLHVTMGEEPVRLLVDSIRTMRSSSSLASFLSDRLQQISAGESNQEIEENVLRDFTRQLQALGEELGTLTLQMDPRDAESFIMTLADSVQTSLVARLLVLQPLAEAVRTENCEFSRQLQALDEELGTFTQQMDPGNAESRIITLAHSLLEHPARQKVVEKTLIPTWPLSAPAAFALAPRSVDGRMFGSQRTYGEKPKYMSAGRLFGSERKYQSVKTHVSEQAVQRIVAEVAAAAEEVIPKIARLLVLQWLAEAAGKEKSGRVALQSHLFRDESAISQSGFSYNVVKNPARQKVVEKTLIPTWPLPVPAAFALAPRSVDGRMFGSQRTYGEKPKYMSAGRLFGSERKYQSVKTHVSEQAVQRIVAEVAAAAEEVIQRIVAEVAAAVDANAMPEEDFKAQILPDQLDQLEISAISARSALTSFTPAKARKAPDARKQVSLVRHSRGFMQSLEGTNMLDLDVKMLMESLGEISLVKQVPTLKPYERRLQAGLPFRKQQSGLKAETGPLKKDVAFLESMDGIEDKKFTHAWRVRDRDVSASPFIGSTTKIRAMRAVAEERKGQIMIGNRGDSRSATPGAASDVSRRTIVTTPPGRIRATRRPATAAAWSHAAEEIARPCSSPGFDARSLSLTASPKPAASSKRGAMRHAQLTTRPVSRGDQDEYVHPTIFNLMTLESDLSRGEHSGQNSKVKRLEEMPDRGTECDSAVLRPAAPSATGTCIYKAVVLLQRFLRGMHSRRKVLELRRKTEFFKSMVAIRSLKQSELNRFLERAIARDTVGQSLEVEAQSCVHAIEALFQIEKQQAIEAGKREQRERLELERARTNAKIEIEQAAEAELRIEKERIEMMAWKIKLDRSRALYEDTKRELHIEDDEDEADLRANHPQAYRDKAHYDGVSKRYLKEKGDYDHSRAVAETEAREAQEALERCTRDAYAWQKAVENARRERAEVEAYATARQFTDPRVSIKERLRAFCASGTEPQKFMRPKSGSRESKDLVSIGVIMATYDHIYAGEIFRVQEVPVEAIRAAFNKHAIEGKLSALNWEIIGSTRPFRGREIQNVQLADALNLKREFSPAECNAFGIDDSQLQKNDFIKSGDTYFTPCGKFLDAAGLIRAMREIGRRINTDESNRLLRAFDVSGDGGIQLKEFTSGLNNLAGVDLPHGLGQETFKDRSYYAGEYYEDKRSGAGMYVTPHHHFYLGKWELGVRHGKGIEGRYSSKNREAMLPTCIATYEHGHRTKVERFFTGNPAHIRMFKDLLHVCDSATKQASKARMLVASDVLRHFVRDENKFLRSATQELLSRADLQRQNPEDTGTNIIVGKVVHKGFEYLYDNDGAYRGNVDFYADVSVSSLSGAGRVVMTPGSARDWM